MSEPFVGEIRMFGGSFAPRSWAFCDGQLIAISQNDALFSLFGTIYGGDGRTSFGLPDMRGRIPLHEGQGVGLSNRRLGSKAGTEDETLTVSQLPSHNHTFQVRNGAGTSSSPVGHTLAEEGNNLYEDRDPTRELAIDTISKVGGSRSHTNMMPYLCVSFIVSLFGIYPSRS